MPGGVYRSNGSTGPAPVTTYFAYIPDRYNMLNAFSNNFTPQNMSGCDFVAQWPIVGTSITHGSSTSAPDGTTNAAKIVESNANEAHAVVAGYQTAQARSGGFKQRLAVFAKAGERTRICLEISNVGRTSGCRTVFDLAGGQIGVANTAFTDGNPNDAAWFTGDVSITPFGNGWYCCWMDAKVGGNGFAQQLGFKIYLDNGSGTGAISTIYAGNGTSGVYFWRSTSMPPNAWGSIGGVTYYEDFNNNTMSNIDLTNSRVAGFDWYINNAFPIFYGLAVTQANKISVADSVLTIASYNGNVPLNFSTAAWKGRIYADDPVGSAADALAMTNPNVDGVGRYFSLPAIFEAKLGYSNLFSRATGNISAFWTESEAQLFAPNQTAFDNNIVAPPGMVEMDFYEYGVNDGRHPDGIVHFLSSGHDGTTTGTVCMAGFREWGDISVYPSDGVIVHRNGVLYLNNTNTTAGVPPPNAQWDVYLPVENTSATWIVFDPTEWICTVIRLPETRYDAGAMLWFCNGRYPGNGFNQGGGGADIRYGKDIPDANNFTDSRMQLSDNGKYPIFLAAGNTGGSLPAGQHSLFVDWVKVHQ